MQFYKPAQGDTAATVAEGYDRNFQHLENSKVDSVDDAGLMTDAEREKLAGIDEGANAYVHPESHSADMITDTAEKVVMTTSEREKLAGIDEEANAYVLPVATAEVLGGIKIGDGLEVAEDGTLSAPGGTNIPPITDAPPIEQLTPSDRLLAFDTDGNPLTATAQQLKDYATEGLASTEALNEALEGRMPVVKAQEGRPEPNSFGVLTGLSGNFGAPIYGAPLLSFGAPGYEAQIILGGIGAWQGAWNRIYFRNRDGDTGTVADWKEFWHSGNFNPATKMPLGDYTGDLNAVEGSGVFRLTGDQSNAPFSGSGTGSTLVQYKWDSRAAFQIYYRFLSNEVYMRERTGGFWGSWVKFYHSGNLTPATAASVGLMSAEDKIKLNAVASAMSLSEDEPATMALNQEESVSSEISIRAQRSAQYQMQTDELLYDALEAFARNHPEYTEFAEWLAVKDRIRAELAKPETTEMEEVEKSDVMS